MYITTLQNGLVAYINHLFLESASVLEYSQIITISVKFYRLAINEIKNKIFWYKKVHNMLSTVKISKVLNIAIYMNGGVGENAEQLKE